AKLWGSSATAVTTRLPSLANCAPNNRPLSLETLLFPGLERSHKRKVLSHDDVSTVPASVGLNTALRTQSLCPTRTCCFRGWSLPHTRGVQPSDPLTSRRPSVLNATVSTRPS